MTHLDKIKQRHQEPKTGQSIAMARNDINWLLDTLEELQGAFKANHDGTDSDIIESFAEIFQNRGLLG